jgi:hypothetical protein
MECQKDQGYTALDNQATLLACIALAGKEGQYTIVKNK